MASRHVSFTVQPISPRPQLWHTGLFGAFCAALLFAAPVAHAKPLPNGANEWTTLYATFDRDLHAGRGVNPYSAGNYTKVVPGGLVGGALQAPGRLSALVFAGANLPPEKGTLRIWIQSPPTQNIFSDRREYFIAAAERNVPQRNAAPAVMEKLPGFNFLLYKTIDNHIAFGLTNSTSAYLTLGTDLPPHPMPVSVSVPIEKLDPAAWHEILVSWDVQRHKFWLRVGDEVREGTLPPSFQAGAFDYLMLANQPNFNVARQGVFPGLLDELLVSNRALDEWLAPNTPTAAAREEAPAPNWPRSEAVLFQSEPLKTMEAQLRTTLDTQARHQNSVGGWNFSFAYPSGIAFMSGTTRSPLPDNRYTNSKDSTSTLAALRYAMAYEVLGDEKYLQVAKRAAQSVLEAQQPDGWWPYSWTKTASGITIENADRIAIEDHVQSGPILLLLYLHRLTGETNYKAAAMRGMDKLISMQNPGGSWSHHFSPAKGHGETQNGSPRGGEFNDFATTGTMKVMLLGYRMTGEKRYLQAYLLGAQWILDAFIDNSGTGGAVGWAQQYDEKNTPIEARNFEPVAIENFASAMAANELINAFQLTGDAKYLQPARRWVTWLQGKLPKYSFYHDIKTGRPIAMFERKVYFTDDPIQLGAYQSAVEKTGKPFNGTGDKDWVGINTIARRLDEAAAATTSQSAPPLPTKTELEAQMQRGIKSMAGWTKTFNWTMATYAPNGGAPGPRVPAGNEFWANVLWTLARGRALVNALPLSHPVLRMPPTFETGEEVNIVAAPLGLYARLSADELNAAKSVP